MLCPRSLKTYTPLDSSGILRSLPQRSICFFTLNLVLPTIEQWFQSTSLLGTTLPMGARRRHVPLVSEMLSPCIREALPHRTSDHEEFSLEPHQWLKPSRRLVASSNTLVHSFLMPGLLPLLPTVCLLLTICASCVSFSAYFTSVINVDLVFLCGIV